MGHAKRAKCSSRQKILHLSLALRNEPSGALTGVLLLLGTCATANQAPPTSCCSLIASSRAAPCSIWAWSIQTHGVVKALDHRTAGACQRHVLGELRRLSIGGEGRCWISMRQYPASRRRHHEHIPVVDEFLGYFWYTRTRTRNIGYPNCRVFIFLGNFRVLVFETRNLKNWNYPIRIFRATRLPSHTW